MPPLTLSGCSPVPLAHYLKALGILRLVAESAHGDPFTSAAWESDQFCLSSRFDEGSLLDFFLNSYEPTPVLAPWNGGSGFYKKDNREAIDAISKSKAECLRPYQLSLEAARAAVRSLDLSEKPDGDRKAQLLQQCRNTLPDDALGWLDAVFVLGQDGPKFPPLLGTGGNDGRLEFTNNFMQRIGELIDFQTGEPTLNSRRWLAAALFGKPAPGTSAKAPIGQFFPGAAGGANATAGFDASSAVNPWDYVLMIEGALLFAAASVKRLESSSDGSLIYPFCVKQAGVGYASASTSDENDARCEMWMPLWERPCTLPELRAIFGEGRAQVAGRTARNGVDFARAAVSLGVDRGISAFQRYGFQVRNGLAYFATPLERVQVRRNVRVDLLTDIDHWYDRIRMKAGAQANPPAPASVSRALNTLERSMMTLCSDDSASAVEGVVVALGQAERALAKSAKWTAEAFLRPLSGLRAEWLFCPDSVEFRLARSLAGMRGALGTRETFWLRQQLEPVEIVTGSDRVWVNWAKTQGNEVTWHEGDFTDCLNTMLSRRIMEFERSGAKGWPDWSPRYAKLEDITAFIEGETNDELLADLWWGLSLLDWRAIDRAERLERDQKVPSKVEYDWRSDELHRAVPSSFYALMKLCFRRQTSGDTSNFLDPAIHQRARSGDGGAASRLAARRLRANGEPALVQELPVEAQLARRTAAALMFPISTRDINLLKLTLQPQNQNKTV